MESSGRSYPPIYFAEPIVFEALDKVQFFEMENALDLTFRFGVRDYELGYVGGRNGSGVSLFCMTQILIGYKNEDGVRFPYCAGVYTGFLETPRAIGSSEDLISATGLIYKAMSQECADFLAVLQKPETSIKKINFTQ